MELIAAPPPNQSKAAEYQLCSKTVANSQWDAYAFDTCFDNCTATFCPQPAWEYMTDAKAQQCAAAHGIPWPAIMKCMETSASSLLNASVARSAIACPHCLGPTVTINGIYAGHHPKDTSGKGDPILQYICGNYSGDKPRGCDQFLLQK